MASPMAVAKVKTMAMLAWPLAVWCLAGPPAKVYRDEIHFLAPCDPLALLEGGTKAEGMMLVA